MTEMFYCAATLHGVQILWMRDYEPVRGQQGDDVPTGHLADKQAHVEDRV